MNIITFHISVGYFDENIIKTIKGTAYCYTIKAKQYGNVVDIYRNRLVVYVGTGSKETVKKA